GRGRALAQRDRHLLDAGVAQIERMGMALAAIADDGDLLALDQVQVGVAVVVNAHGFGPFLGAAGALLLLVLAAVGVALPPSRDVPSTGQRSLPDGAGGAGRPAYISSA